MNSVTRRRFLFSSASLAGLISTTGCGTILYPERVGQRRGNLGTVDWTIAGMNTIGLVFFFVPGVIAFAIDYYNGTLFYPEDCVGELRSEQLKKVTLTENERSMAGVESAVSGLVGHPVKFSETEYQTEEIGSISHFWSTYDKLTNKLS